MNLTNFLEQIDVLTAQYSKEQLVSFIHDIGRVLPENSRHDFLRRLKSAADEKKGKTSNADSGTNSGFDALYQNVKDDLKKIDSQDVVITSELNGNYDEWYHSDEEEYDYIDENGVSDMVMDACHFVHTCMDEGKYKEGCEVGRQLLWMEILCLSEYGDEELSIHDMAVYGLLDCDMQQVILDVLYCAYQASSFKERPEVLYEIITNANNDKVTLESIVQHGDQELPDFQEFLVAWIEYLGSQTSKEADRLLIEAVGLRNDIEAACKYAKQFVTSHPGLYLNILINEKSLDLKSLISIGMEAMKKIPAKYIVRSKAALTTAEYIVKSNEWTERLEECYFAAYESDTSAMNYLRVLLNGNGCEENRKKLRNVFMAFSGEKNGDSFAWRTHTDVGTERAENRPGANMLLTLRFFDGQFDEVLSEGLNKREALGWSGTFMKQGMALYLLLCYEGERYNKGMLAMFHIIKTNIGFSAAEYQTGILDALDSSDSEMFYHVFSQWKSLVKLDSDIRDKIIKKIEGLIEKRTEGIMNANRRNYYGECAAYIAALGEVQESIGDKGAKQKLMTRYKDKYSRRTAFRAEMKGYGWIDVKKK